MQPNYCDERKIKWVHIPTYHRSAPVPSASFRVAEGSCLIRLLGYYSYSLFTCANCKDRKCPQESVIDKGRTGWWVPSCRKKWMAIQWSGFGSNQVIFMNHEEELVKVFWNLACLFRLLGSIAWNSRIRLYFFFVFLFFFSWFSFNLHLHRVQGVQGVQGVQVAPSTCVSPLRVQCIASLTKRSRWE